MPEPPFDPALIGALLRPPDQGYLARIDRARHEATAVSLDAARHFGAFAERVHELDEAEFEELFRESFAPADAVALRRAAEQIDRGGWLARHDVLPILGRLLAPLDAARNPFAVLFKAICMLLLAGGQEPPNSGAVSSTRAESAR